MAKYRNMMNIRKNMRSVAVLTVLSFTAACNNDVFVEKEEQKDPELTITGQTTVETDRNWYYFDILSGTPPYTVTCDDYWVYSEQYKFPTAQITQRDTTIRLDMLNPTSVVTVTDAKMKQVQISITSTSERVSLFKFAPQTPIPMTARRTYSLDYGYGAPFTIVDYGEKDVFFAEMTGDNLVTMGSNVSGTQGWVLFSDQAGVVRYGEFNISYGEEITGNSLEIEAIEGDWYSFPITWGDGWELTERPDLETNWWDCTLYDPNDEKNNGVFTEWTFVVIVGEQPATFVFTNDEGEQIELSITPVQNAGTSKTARSRSAGACSSYMLNQPLEMISE